MTEPRVFPKPEIPADVMKVRDKAGDVWIRSDPVWSGKEWHHSLAPDYGTSTAWLLTHAAPLTEVTE